MSFLKISKEDIERAVLDRRLQDLANKIGAHYESSFTKVLKKQVKDMTARLKKDLKAQNETITN
jgi:uncharacterized protein YidB (DUF937 family)